MENKYTNREIIEAVRKYASSEEGKKAIRSGQERAERDILKLRKSLEIIPLSRLDDPRRI